MSTTEASEAIGPVSAIADPQTDERPTLNIPIKMARRLAFTMGVLAGKLSPPKRSGISGAIVNNLTLNVR